MDLFSLLKCWLLITAGSSRRKLFVVVGPKKEVDVASCTEGASTYMNELLSSWTTTPAGPWLIFNYSARAARLSRSNCLSFSPGDLFTVYASRIAPLADGGAPVCLCPPPPPAPVVRSHRRRKTVLVLEVENKVLPAHLQRRSFLLCETVTRSMNNTPPSPTTFHARELLY